jgi:ATP-dependent DNA helicase PIF1
MTKQIGRYKTNSSLNEDQVKVFKAFETGKNIFINGSAGVGKSYALKQLVSDLDWAGIRYGLTAMTGTAALQVGAMTLHGWAGIGLGEGTDQQVLAYVLKNKKAVNRIKFNKVLIVDEISMAKASLLDKLDFVFKSIRTSSRPFGGLQMVFCGDPLQLPPVFKGDEETDSLFFEAKSWVNARVEKVTLNKIVRQQGDQKFAKLLNEVRVGNIENIHLLEECIGRKFDKGINPVKLYSRNLNVENENNRKLFSLSGVAKSFKSIDFGSEHHIQFFNKNCPAPQTLELKVGAQVMLLKNVDLAAGLCNGSIGVVTGFPTTGIEVAFDSGKVILERDSWEIKEQNVNAKGEATLRTVAERMQYPLKLAWAITIHKSQGATLDHVEVDIADAFATGQAYVSLSRVREMKSLSLKPFNASVIKVNKKALEYSLK